jgi:hypothetical protein
MNEFFLKSTFILQLKTVAYREKMQSLIQHGMEKLPSREAIEPVKYKTRQQSCGGCVLGGFYVEFAAAFKHDHLWTASPYINSLIQEGA